MNEKQSHLDYTRLFGHVTSKGLANKVHLPNLKKVFCLYTPVCIHLWIKGETHGLFVYGTVWCWDGTPNVIFFSMVTSFLLL